MHGAFCLIGLFLVNGSQVPGQEGPKNPTGEALPAGALERLGSPCFRVTGPVFGARFLDGGKKLLVRVHQKPQSSFDHGKGDFLVFDMESGVEQSRLRLELNSFLGHWGTNGPVGEFISFPHWCLSPDAALLATVTDWGDLTVRALASGKTILAISDDWDLQFVRFTPNGKRVAAVAVRREAPAKNATLVEIRTWDLQTGKEVHKFVPPIRPRETFQAHWFTFSPDGAYLAATGYEDGEAGVVRVWDVAGKMPSWRVPGNTANRDQARAIAISPDSKTLAASHAGRLKLWDLDRRQELKDLAEFNNRCATLDFSPDGKMLIAGTGKEEGDRLRLWNLASGAEIVLPVQQSSAYLFSSDGRSLVLADADNGRLLVCERATGKVRRSLSVAVPQSSTDQLEHRFYKASQGMGWPFALTSDGKTLMACDQPGQLRRFDVATGKEISGPGPRMTLATSLAFAPDGKKLLAAGPGNVVMHDLARKTNPLELQRPRKAAGNKSKDMPKPIQVALSGDGRRIAAGWDDGVVCLWDANNGKLLWQRIERIVCCVRARRPGAGHHRCL